MKKAFALVVLIVTPFILFAQGTIFVANSASAVVQMVHPPGVGGFTYVAVNGGMVQFFAAADSTPFSPLGALEPYSRSFALNYSSLAGFLAANSGWNAYNTANIAPIAGRFNAGTVTVAPLAHGGNIEYVMIGWTGPSTTLDAAIASGSAFIGESVLYTGIATGDPTTKPIPGIPSSMSSSFLGLTLAPIAGAIPEPSIFSQAGLGAVLLLLFRRRG